MSQYDQQHLPREYLEIFALKRLHILRLYLSVLSCSGEFSLPWLHHWEVLEGSAFWHYPSCSQRCQHVRDCSSPLLHWYQGIWNLFWWWFNLPILFCIWNQKISAFALHIQRVSRDASLFASYFWWKDFYKIEPCNHKIICHKKLFEKVVFVIKFLILSICM